jgi:spectinomycin phosphotransferase
MLERPDLADDALAEHIRSLYRLDVHRIVFLALGADTSAAAYRVVSSQGDYFVKLRRGKVDEAKVQLPRFLATAGPTCVLAPIPTGDGRLSTSLGDFTVILCPFIEGRDGFEKSLTEEQWTTLGSALRAVHEVRLPPALQATIRVEAYTPKWREQARTYLANAVSGSDPRPDSAPAWASDPVAREFADVLADRRQQLSAMVARAESLVERMRAKPRTLVLCHGDIHAGNVMIAEDGTLALVDWDDPLLAPRERDLMYVGGGIGGVWNLPAEAAAFHRGYGPAEVDDVAIAYYRCERIVEDLALFCEQLLLSEHGGDDRALSLRYFLDQFRPGDVVDIAERTYSAL